MRPLKEINMKKLLTLLFCLLFVGCSSVKPMKFKNGIPTENKAYQSNIVYTNIAVNFISPKKDIEVVVPITNRADKVFLKIEIPQTTNTVNLAGYLPTNKPMFTTSAIFLYYLIFVLIFLGGWYIWNKRKKRNYPNK